MFIRIKELNLLFFFLLPALLLAACAEKAPIAVANDKALRIQVNQSRELLGVNSVLILPIDFEAGARDSASNDKLFYSALVDAARAELNLEVRGDEKIFSQLERSSKGRDASGYLDIAARLGADAVIRTSLHRYVERIGSAVGASVPAGVDFSMSLVRISDGKELWRANYNFQDAPASENLLTAGQKFQAKGTLAWRSAKSSLESGFHSAYRDLNDKRTNQFTVG